MSSTIAKNRDNSYDAAVRVVGFGPDSPQSNLWAGRWSVQTFQWIWRRLKSSRFIDESNFPNILTSLLSTESSERMTFMVLVATRSWKVSVLSNSGKRPSSSSSHIRSSNYFAFFLRPWLSPAVSSIHVLIRRINDAWDCFSTHLKISSFRWRDLPSYAPVPHPRLHCLRCLQVVEPIPELVEGLARVAAFDVVCVSVVGHLSSSDFL
jgi:hypothetical protein